MTQAVKYKSLHPPGSEEFVNELVELHAGWASSIARTVARAWNLDWQLDGLDGGAYEALVFCARRFDPTLGVPFRAYARRRIHEASTEEARSSKSWKTGVGANSEEDQAAREISATLFHVYPELREGLLPIGTDDSNGSMRTSIRQMLASATVIASIRDLNNNAESFVDYKTMLQCVATMEPVHQSILWELYWQGKSMRTLAQEWEIDELNIMREHKSILEFIFGRFNQPLKYSDKKLKVRPGLRTVAQLLKRSKVELPFSRFSQALQTATLVLALCCVEALHSQLMS